MKISASEAVEIFKEIQETPEKLFDMIQVAIQEKD